MVKRRQQGEQGPDEAEPELPLEVEYLWRMWVELHTARASGDMAPNPVSWVDIDAFSRVADERIEPWEARAIRAVDDAYMLSLGEKEDSAPGGH